MSVLWKQAPTEASPTAPRDDHVAASGWQAVPCASGTGTLCEFPEFRLHGYHNRKGRRVLLISAEARDDRLLVNGRPVIGGLASLEHQDEIRIRDQRWYFSDHSRPEVIEYRAGEGRAPRCGVCRGKIQDGHTVVRCPGCSRLFHELHEAASGESRGDDAAHASLDTDSDSEVAARRCWTYADKCKFCGHPTDLSGERAWQPGCEELEHE